MNMLRTSLVCRQVIVPGLSLLAFLLPLLLAGCSGESSLSDERNPFYLRGVRLREAEKYDEAATEFDKCLRLSPSSSKADLQLAMLYEDHLADPIRAIYHYNAYLHKAPKSENAETVQKWLTRVERTYFQKLADRYPEDLQLLAGRGSPDGTGTVLNAREVILNRRLKELSREINALRGVAPGPAGTGGAATPGAGKAAPSFSPPGPAPRSAVPPPSARPATSPAPAATRTAPVTVAPVAEAAPAPAPVSALPSPEVAVAVAPAPVAELQEPPAVAEGPIPEPTDDGPAEAVAPGLPVAALVAAPPPPLPTAAPAAPLPPPDGGRLGVTKQPPAGTGTGPVGPATPVPSPRAPAAPGTGKFVPISTRKPAPTASAPAANSYVYYTVQRGDTLASLSRRFLGSPTQWERIRALNADTLRGQNNVKVGMKLRIPVGSH